MDCFDYLDSSSCPFHLTEFLTDILADDERSIPTLNDDD